MNFIVYFVFSRLHCPRIVQFIGAFYEADSNAFGIVTEYMPNGNLHDLIHTHKIELEKIQKYKIVSQMYGLEMNKCERPVIEGVL